MNLRFDEMISSPARLAILAALVPGPSVSFTEMKAATGLADGNLHVQSHKLADAGYLKIGKARQGRRSVTEFRLTELGLKRFKLHVRELQKILDVEVEVEGNVDADADADAEADAVQPVAPSERPDDSMVWS